MTEQAMGASVPDRAGGLRPEPASPSRPVGAHPSRGAWGTTVYEKPAPAVLVLADALGISLEEARRGLRALVEAGYGIGPRLPTNGMLAAYIEATVPAKHHEAIITAIGKARRRWTAMLQHGTEMALSLKYVPDAPRQPACPPCEGCGAEMVQMTHDTWECGRACDWSIGRDSDGSGEAGKTRSGLAEGDSAGRNGIAQGDQHV